jgi:hypothetical protein
MRRAWARETRSSLGVEPMTPKPSSNDVRSTSSLLQQKLPREQEKEARAATHRVALKSRQQRHGVDRIGIYLQ